MASTLHHPLITGNSQRLRTRRAGMRTRLTGCAPAWTPSTALTLDVFSQH